MVSASIFSSGLVLTGLGTGGTYKLQKIFLNKKYKLFSKIYKIKIGRLRKYLFKTSLLRTNTNIIVIILYLISSLFMQYKM